MRHLKAVSAIRYSLLCLVFFLTQSLLWAQADSTISSTTTTKTTQETTTWYSSPWVWVAGAALFILLLAAILKGSGGRSSSGTSDKVTVTKTVSRDTDAA